MINDTKSLIAGEEGRRSVAYWDNAKPRNATNGIGHKDNSMVVGVTTWSDAKIDATFEADAAEASSGIRRGWPPFDSLDIVRQAYLISMAFQLGVDGVLKFRHMLAALAAGGWRGAHDEALSSDWFAQTEARCKRAAAAFLTGQWQQIQ